MKKVPIGRKPVHEPRPANPDDWVNDRELSDDKKKRLTIDIPVSLHKRVKSQCALRNVRMADIVRDMLEQEFPLPETRGQSHPSLPQAIAQTQKSVKS